MKQKTIKDFIKMPINVLFEQVIQEGVNDKAIFKAVFLAGGPGSGKDYVLDNTLAGHGLTEINSDKALEYLMDREGLDKRMPKSEEEARNLIRGTAKGVTELRQRLALQGRNGLIINGTGDDPEKIKKIKERLEELGYESSMVMVNTADEASKQRNIERGQRGGRTVPENIRKEKWDSVQAARPDLAKLFGDSYREFDNSEDLREAPPEIKKQKQEEMLDIYKGVQKFVAQPPKHENAQAWIAQELQSKDNLKVKKSDVGRLPAGHLQQRGDDKGVSSQASGMGLQYLGFGRYGKNHKVTHRVVNGKLVEIPKEPVGQGRNVPITGSSMSAKNVSTSSTRAKVPTKEKNVLSKLKQKETQKEEINASFGQLFSEAYEFSDNGAYNLLMLGTPTVESKQTPVTEDNHNLELTQKQMEKMHLLRDSTGKVRVFMMRRSATEHANQKGGVVYKAPRGYVIKLKEEVNHGIYKESSELVIRSDRARQDSNATYGSSRETRGGSREESSRGILSEGKINECTESCDCTTTKKTLSQTKKALQGKITEIDAGTEIGVSLSGTGENPSRGSLSTRAKKRPFDEMTGDETGMSIGDQKELELRNQGISLATFKSKKVV
jgi:hypothetical protein